MIVKIQDSVNPYKNLIEDAISLSFPVPGELSNRQVVDSVLSEIIASSKTRFGPAPILDSQYLMKKAIEKYFIEYLYIF